MKKTPTLPSRPHSYHHGDLRRALLDAALELIRTSGPAAFTLRQAAVRAGVSHNAPYRHFSDKASLLAELAEEGSVALRKSADRAVAAAGEDPVERLRAVGLAYIRFAVAQPGHFRVMFGTVRSPELVPSQGTTFELLVESITSCQTSGRFKQVEPLDIALPAWAVVHGLAMLLVDDMLSSCNFNKSIDQMAWTVTQVIFDAFSI
jgi:AcrR family transcriptional regulator